MVQVRIVKHHEEHEDARNELWSLSLVYHKKNMTLIKLVMKEDVLNICAMMASNDDAFAYSGDTAAADEDSGFWIGIGIAHLMLNQSVSTTRRDGLQSTMQACSSRRTS
jgi:hypothetical protein